MITYTEKPGLGQAIAAAGEYLAQDSNGWIASDPVKVQAIIDGYTLDQAKSFVSLQVTAHAKTLRDRAVAAVSAGELASWSIKRDEARAYKASNGASDCPMLTLEAGYRGVTLPTLVDKVIANSNKFSSLEAAIGGADGKHRDSIAGLSTFEALAAYDYSTGWPEF